MYDVAIKLYKEYKIQLNKSPIVIPKKPDNKVQQFNSKLKKYANESLKKSIQKIEDMYKDPNYKIKLIVNRALNDNNQNNIKNSFNLFAGATILSYSLYLVYSFVKTCRT